MLTDVYHYDLLKGLIALGQVLLLLVLLVSIRYSFSLAQPLKHQDESIPSGSSGFEISDVFLYFRRFIISVIGYRGERRERINTNDIDVKWMLSNWYYIIKRFLIFYSIFISFGIILTRPVYFVDATPLPYGYDHNNLRAFSYLLIYIVSNSIFDYISILFTFHHVERILQTGKVLCYGALDIFVAFCLFLPNQLISCALWYLKRSGPPVEFSQNYLFDIFDVVLWPYGLVGNSDTHTIIGSLFPGQLLITGTVFIPTVLMMFVAILFFVFLRFAYYAKRFLIYIRMDYFCKKYLEISLADIWHIPTGGSFGYCNIALILMLNGFFVSFLYDNVKQLIVFFR